MRPEPRTVCALSLLKGSQVSLCVDQGRRMHRKPRWLVEVSMV